LPELNPLGYHVRVR